MTSSKTVWLCVPGSLDQVTGGYIYARNLAEHLPRSGWRVQVVELPGGFPRPTLTEMQEALQRLDALPAADAVLVDGLVYGVLPETFLKNSGRKWTAIVHHPLAEETGLSPGLAERLRRGEEAALSAAHGIIVPSAWTKRVLTRDYAVPSARIAIAPPGIARGSRSIGSGRVARLLTVGTLTARKGHDVLVSALTRLSDLDWDCRFVGSLDRDPETARRVRALIRTKGLDGRVALLGEMGTGDLMAEYQQADIFVLPSRYEGYGIAFAEALAHGVPVVGCSAGATVDTVPEGTGLLVPPEDEAGLAQAIRLLLTDSGKRRELSDAAWEHGRNLPDWRTTARLVADALI